MNDRVMQFRVGVVVLATAIITGILIVLFGDLPSLVQATYPLKMSFSDARGVADGTPVRKNGILVGRVTSVELARLAHINQHRLLAVHHAHGL